MPGYDARQVITTVTVREKGSTLEDAGGAVMTVDSWLGPEIPALKELAEFQMRYWKAINPDAASLSAEQMGAVMVDVPHAQERGRTAAEGRREAARHAALDARPRSRA